MNQYFDDYLDEISLKIDDEERENIKEKHTALREALREELPLLVDDFLTGSYKRNTLIKPKKDTDKFDVDIFICFDKEDYEEAELEDLRKIAYGALLKIKKDRPELGITSVNDSQRRAVCVEYGTRFTIDVVPALQIKKDKLYRVFDKKTLEPVDSNPKYHASLLSQANDDYDKKLVPIIKILKGWKRLQCPDVLKSYHLELLVYTTLLDKKFSSYSDSIAEFFSEVGGLLQEPCMTDPANTDHLIDEYLDTDKTREELLQAVEKMNGIAQATLALEEAGEDSTEEWDKIFRKKETKKSTGIYTGAVSSSIPPARPWGYA